MQILEPIKSGRPCVSIEGRRFGRLIAVQKTRGGKMLCKCDCGNERIVMRGSLLKGLTKSCGCFHSEQTRNANTQHGHATREGFSREYHSWSSMRTRCTNAKRSMFKYYGGRGITICKEWESFTQFLADMGPRPPATSLDRIDPNGNYEPANCRWATPLDQSRNRRNVKCAP